LYAYPWSSGELRDSSGPRMWQREVLANIGAHLETEETRHTPLLIAVASGHGIGKGALAAMVTKWALDTCEDCKVVLTANTGTQLSTKTQPELAKWCRLAITSHWFDVKATSISVRDPRHEKTWRADLIPWSEHNIEAFAGLHNQGKRIVVIFDEASAIADSIWETTAGALTDANTEVLWLVLGNPTKSTGTFRECFGRMKHRWKTYQIDARHVEGTNTAQLEQWVDDYGEDSDFVRVRVRGEFPRTGSSQFIPHAYVSAARKYRAEGMDGLPKVMGVDVARFGDDQTVIGMRQGRKFVVLEKMRGKDTVFVAERIINWREKVEPDAIIVDGDGLGAGTIDHLRYRGYRDKLFEFHGGERASDSHKYYNKRSEVWGAMRDWLADGAEIPDDPELDAQLTGPEFGYAQGKRSSGALFLESKQDMKSRGLESPDVADCLAMTFAVRIALPQKTVVRAPSTRRNDGLGWMAT
jgi:hypothetical protein